MKTLSSQRKMAVSQPEPEPDGTCAIRMSHRAQRQLCQGHISPRYLLRCGCCNRSVEIYYDPEGLEINGVNGSVENWREILLPLLGMKRRGKVLVPEKVQRGIPMSGPKRAKKVAA
jgi:polyferredoxin